MIQIIMLKECVHENNDTFSIRQSIKCKKMSFYANTWQILVVVYKTSNASTIY